MKFKIKSKKELQGMGFFTKNKESSYNMDIINEIAEGLKSAGAGGGVELSLEDLGEITGHPVAADKIGNVRSTLKAQLEKAGLKNISISVPAKVEGLAILIKE